MQCADNLRREHGALRVALSLREPSPTGDVRYDAALAALVDHYAAEEALPIPAWTSQPSLTLADPWIPDPYAPDDIAALTPPAFVRHGVLLAATELESV
ncbi:MAG: hypothetical protein ACKO91_12285 [Acidimicrobiales bacterium]